MAANHVVVRPLPRAENIEKWTRKGGEVARRGIVEAVARIEAMEARHGYRYDVLVPWSEWFLEQQQCCDKECCR